MGAGGGGAELVEKLHNFADFSRICSFLIVLTAFLILLVFSICSILTPTQKNILNTWNGKGFTK